MGSTRSSRFRVTAKLAHSQSRENGAATNSTARLLATAMKGEDQANGIAFALACYELSGKEAPDFGRFAEGEIAS